MGSSKIIQAIGVLIAIVIALIIISQAISSGRNAIGQLAKFVMIGGGVCGLFAPRVAAYLLLFSTAYLDLLKRLLAVDRMQFLDVYYVLGFAPVTLTGICVGILLSYFLGRREFRRSDLVALILGSAISLALAGGVLFQMGLGGQSLAMIANLASYAVLLFIVPTLFPEPADKIQFLRTAILLFVPVAAYGIYQYLVGFTMFEMEYLKSGFSSEIRHFQRGYVRVFSTLNSAHALSVMSSLFAAILWVRFTKSDSPGSPKRGFGWVVLLVPLFLGAAILTLTRAGWFSGLVVLFGIMAFRAKWSTVLVYFLGIALIGSLVVFVDFWDKVFQEGFVEVDESGGFEEFAFNTGTWRARLYGIQSLVDHKELVQPFGTKLAGVDVRMDDWYSHDLFTTGIIYVGYVPMIILAILGIWLILRTHACYFSMPEGNEKRLFLVSVAAAVGLFAGGLTNQSALTTYPVNFYFWMFSGMALSVYLRHRQTSPAKTKSSRSVEDAEAEVSGRYGGAPRFS